jgi:flagellar biosynthesis/type III secretory pathway chaperone
MTAQAAAEERQVLLGLLAQEDGLYARLAELAEDEHTAIRGGTTEAIETLVAEKARIIDRLVLLEAERLASVSRLANTAEVVGEALTLSDVVALWPTDEIVALSGIAESLRANVGRLEGLNRRNASLLRASLAMLNRWVELLTGVWQEPQTYERTGRRHVTAASLNRVARG